MDSVRPHSTATAYRRQRQIEDCLYENMLHLPYPSISVSDICRQVGISRKAFYNYYRDKDACFRAVIRRKIRESMLLTARQLPGNGSPLETTTVMLRYWKSQKDFLDMVVRNQLLHFLLLESIENVMQEETTVLDLLNTPDVKSDSDILACYMSSQITLLMQWYLRNFDTPEEEMAKKYLRVIHVPLIVGSGE